MLEEMLLKFPYPWGKLVFLYKILKRASEFSEALFKGVE
jgi:hypothetical protein